LPAGRVAYYQEALGFRLAAGAVSRRSIVRRRTDVGHAGEDGRVAGSTHGFELLGRGGHGGLDRGDLAQPTLLLGLRKPVDEVYTRAAIRARCANCSACPWRSSCRCGPVPACGSTVTLTADVWTERVLLAGAEPVRRYLDGPAAGEPAVTRHRLGRGTAWHISTRLSGSDLDAALADAGLPPVTPATGAGRCGTGSPRWRLCQLPDRDQSHRARRGADHLRQGVAHRRTVPRRSTAAGRRRPGAARCLLNSARPMRCGRAAEASGSNCVRGIYGYGVEVFANGGPASLVGVRVVVQQ
jgi:hypothetical protein